MKSQHLPIQPIKRRLLQMIGLLPWLTSRTAAQSAGSELARRFRGIRSVDIRLDSASFHRYVTITTETGRSIAAPSGLERGGRQNFNFSGDDLPIPKTVTVKWRKDIAGNRGGGDPWIGGTLLGDYTIEVASRIPDAVLDSVRREGGQLRIKFRLADDGVLFGWDIERRPGFDPKRPEVHVRPVYSMVGGDFQEAVLVDVERKIIQKGWYIDKIGQRIETDW